MGFFCFYKTANKYKYVYIFFKKSLHSFSLLSSQKLLISK